MHPQGAADTISMIRIEFLHLGRRNIPGEMPDLASCEEAIPFWMAMSFNRGGWYLYWSV